MNKRPFVGVDLTKGFYDYPITQFIGLTTINIELTNRCNKSCWLCGRRHIEKEYPELAKFDKDMDLDLAYKILIQLPPQTVVQYHNSGEPTLYPYLYQVLSFRNDIIKCFNTNGKLLLEKADYIIDNLDTLTISIIENDPEGDEQYDIVKKFLEIKSDRKPFMIYRLLGNVSGRSKILEDNKDFVDINLDYDEEREQRWYKLPGIVATRILHSPYGSYDYEKKVTIPEIGICWDILSHMAINVDGLVSLCVRFDPEKELVIGNAKQEYLVDIWNGAKRKEILQKHIDGKRSELPYCGKKCDYYGCPTSY